ncbi:hypothetical protein BO94DRAFT_563174 [Aspergillus sclerotioniger CBS 115572]|uniref:Aminoglycoside phosphotransferase domain-containing protein n=1 Tax=Aspergillus sclerotioniger CBS 115572 TaxID=1450535 RepID=A0A317XAH3_9EURO|nr:hypothetical protein BO94DRAFT_563174 [Aspergillus sclerotioniger CBS 115572]PWY94567.1 hypothetical protein BO94DRAFT_563174 [Aspergillus sclerotioniger CBS 115572]
MSFFWLRDSAKPASKDLWNNQVIKSGTTLYDHEVDNMEFIAEHTTIPISCVHSVERDTDGKLVKIYMDYIPGRPLNEAWTTMTETQKRSVADDLHNYVNQLRTLVGNYIGAAHRGLAVIGQHVFHEGGPFDQESQFNDFLLSKIISKVPDTFRYHATRTLKDNHEIVFTHSDLAPRDILVRDGRVTGILDWEHTGWYPEYWEYERTYRHFNDVPGWMDYVDMFLPRKYSEEIVALSYLSRYSH